MRLTDNCAPLNFGMLGPEILRKTVGGFPDDFQVSYDRVGSLVVLQKTRCALDRIRNVRFSQMLREHFFGLLLQLFEKILFVQFPKNFLIHELLRFAAFRIGAHRGKVI
jgi:hypothetical protein